jgi:hypothetical protein
MLSTHNFKQVIVVKNDVFMSCSIIISEVYLQKEWNIRNKNYQICFKNLQ